MRIVSWNVNGLRSVARKGFLAWLEQSGADIVAMQEVRASFEQLPEDLRTLKGWSLQVVPAEKAGYSGVGLLSRRPPDELITQLDVPRFDSEGRLQLVRFGKLWLANVYFPNGSGQNRDNSRIPFKLDFYRCLYDRLEPLKSAGEEVLVLGDFNTAPYAIDLARPKENEKTSGFCPEERVELIRWLSTGWTDTFRHFNPDPNWYTWWSNRPGVRQNNIGWRIDFVLATAAAMKRVSHAFIAREVLGSDHCPIGVDLSS